MKSNDYLEAHLKDLKLKHAILNDRIDTQKDPDYIMSVLKKEKLALKDEIEKYERKVSCGGLQS